MDSLPSGPITLDGEDAEVERLKLLVQESRKKIEEARDDIDRLNKRSLQQKAEAQEDHGFEDIVGDPVSFESELKHLSGKEREKALKRLRNREAARRSRQRKQAKMVNLQEAVDTLERENLLLIKCIENFGNKALEAKQMKDGLKNRSSAIGTIVKPSPESHSFRREIPMLENLDGLQSKVSEGPLTGRQSARSTKPHTALEEQLAALSSRDISPREDEIIAEKAEEKK
eukprot:jgi/Picsp_1/6033/NSC_03387-R1_---NA---